MWRMCESIHGQEASSSPGMNCSMCQKQLTGQRDLCRHIPVHHECCKQMGVKSLIMVRSSWFKNSVTAQDVLYNIRAQEIFANPRKFAKFANISCTRIFGVIQYYEYSSHTAQVVSSFWCADHLFTKQISEFIKSLTEKSATRGYCSFFSNICLWL